MLAAEKKLLFPQLIRVKRALPSLSASKASTERSFVQSVITPLLPPEPIDTLIEPVQILSNKKNALCVSCKKIMAFLCLILFLILPIVWSNLPSPDNPLQFMVMTTRSLISGPGLGLIPPPEQKNTNFRKS